MGNFNHVWKAAVLTITKVIFYYQLLSTMTTTCLFLLQLSFTDFFSFSLYHLLRVRKDLPIWERPLPGRRENWWQWPHIVKLTMKATAPSPDAQTLLTVKFYLWMGLMY